MKNIVGILGNLFILRKCLGMASSQIIHRDASRMDCGNSFILNNFSLLIYLWFSYFTDKQIDLQSLSACINHIYYRFEAPLHREKESQFIIRDQDSEMNMLALLLSFTYIEISSHHAHSSLYNTGEKQLLSFQIKIIFSLYSDMIYKFEITFFE